MNKLEVLQPVLADYELVDSGDGAKLERFGERMVARPEPQALWKPALPAGEWERLADATFQRNGSGAGGSGSGSGSGFGSGSGSGSGDERGRWQLKPGVPERWTMEYVHGAMKLRMRLALTGFKHVGVFPEQAANWDFIYDTLRGMEGGGAHRRVLNLFAYTGGATLAARSAGAEVTHVDSVKQTVSWARDNARLSGFDDATDGSGGSGGSGGAGGAGSSGGAGGSGIRWIVDDALKFVRREVRRGSLYDGIVLDPPAYGRGPEGEKWVLEQGLDQILEMCAAVLKPHGFLVLNLYSMGLSAVVARTAVHSRFGVPTREQYGELAFADRAGKNLPLGVFYRFVR
jgi:23S rRNA (cytosine1962-C5)-methyltransferase